MAERRLVSVLFVDLVGFTTYSEGRDAEEVRDMLTRYFERAEEIIGLYGGVVEKFIGDAVMAVWGTPVAHEDDAGRAVRAALELVKSVADLGRSVGAELAARAGVYTGEASVNLAAAGQGMVAGDMVNTASRLQSVAEPGTILVDHTTYLGARDAIAFESAGHLTLKGREEAVEAWRPTRVTAALGGFRPADALEPVFTGRDEELRLIKDLLHSTGREHKPKLASVLGIGGIGKSRLVWELYKYVDGLSDVTLWHQGRSPSYGEGVAFWALAEMVRMRAGIAETDDDGQASAKLDECLSEYVPDEIERRWLKPHLAHLVGIEEGTEAGREQLFAAWRTFFERIAEQGTVLLVFEDLHWADAGLTDFIEYLMEWARSSPILLLTLARPELMDRRPTWGAGQRSFTSIHLEPLGDDDTTLLLKSLADDLPAAVREEIRDRAEGVPLYAVEMVRMLIDRGDLVAEESGYRWVGKAEGIDVPRSLHSLIASRLDALTDSDRLLVQDASVLGKTFTIDSLMVVAATPREELEPCLNDLVKREILLVDIDPKSPERGQYGFVQSLIREVAYQTLSNQNRRERHLAAAEYFASTGEADMIDVIATHYMEAYKNSRKDDSSAAELAEQARRTLVEAAERATSLGSPAQALSLVEKALAITSEPEEKGKLLTMAGSAAVTSRQLAVGSRYLESAIEVLQDTGDNDTLVRAQAELGLAYFLGSDLDRAVAIVEEAIEGVSDKTSLAAATLFMQLARFYMLKGDHEKTEMYAAMGMPAAERFRDVALVADGLITRGTASAVAGRTLEADAMMMGALQLSETHGLVVQQMRALNNMSENQLRIDPTSSFRWARQGVDIARRFGDRTYEGGMLGTAIAASTHLADWEWFHSALEDAVSVLEELGSIVLPPIATAFAYVGDLPSAERYLALFEELVANSSFMQDEMALAGMRSTIAFVTGDFDRAKREAAGIRRAELARESEYDLFITPFGLAGRIAIWSGALEDAEKALSDARSLIIQNPWHSCRIRTLEAGTTALRGDRDAALEIFRDALQQWDALQIPLGKAMCQMDLVLTIGGAEAAAASAAAETFFKEAGNDQFVRRLHAIS